MSNPPAERPWPAPSPATGWWQGETPPPPPADLRVLATEREIVTLPGDDTPTEVGKELVPFPLWPAVPAAAEGEEKEHRGRHTEQARIEEWPPPLLRLGRSPAAKPVAPVSRRARPTRRPAGGLAGLLVLALLAAFLAWTSAEPLWLAAGRGDAGTVKITRCGGKSVLRRCIGTFHGPSFTAERVTVLGGTAAEKVPGVELSARMVGRTGRMAYVGGTEGLHARWSVGLGLLLLCGAAIAWLTGALRLPDRRTRLTAVLLSFAGPLLLLVGMLAATLP